MQIYTVQSGDSLWHLSQRFGVTMDRIISLNQLLEPNQLILGQALLIPAAYPVHTVQSGDTLWAIAQRYQVSVQDLRLLNQISEPTQLYPGQSITIPVLYHTVQPRESLWSIAQQYETTIPALQQANSIVNPAVIYPGQTIRIPRQRKPTIEVNAYITQFGAQGAQTVRDKGIYLTYLCPFGYRIQSDGGLQAVDDTAVIAAATSDQAVPMLSITNFSATETGSALAHTILTDTSLQNKLLSNVIAVMKTKGYQGLNVDFENVYPGDKQRYNQFLRLAVQQLHQSGFFVSSALAPKTSASQKGLLYEAHDYAAHGQIVDFVILMTYEWGYRLGPPQAISPLDQIKRVLDYAVSVIPRNKIFMGFQVYARDWLLPHQSGMEAETFDMQEAVRRAVQHGAAIQYDRTAQSPYYRYTDSQHRTHEVWFEDARSAKAKLDTVKSYRLRGVSYWVLGYPFPQNWALLQDTFRIRKLR